MPRSAGGGSVASRSRPIRKAASVLPEPVGAHSSVCEPEAMAGQPCSCAGVGPSGKASANQAAVAGEKRSVSAAGIPAVSLPSARDRAARRWPAPDPPAAAVERARPRLELRARGPRRLDAVRRRSRHRRDGRDVDDGARRARRSRRAARHLPLPHRPHRGEPRSGGADGRRGADVAHRRHPVAPLARPRRGRRDATPPRGERLPRGGAGLGLRARGRSWSRTCTRRRRRG